MNRQTRAALAWLMLGLMVFTGCTPKQPFFLHEDGDLSHYLDHMQEISHPDVANADNPEAIMSIEPLTVLDPEFDNWWDLTLEEAIAIALHNSKVIRNVGQVSQFGIADGLLNRTAASPTVFDPAITASNTSTRPNIGSNGVTSLGAVGTSARGLDPELFSTAQTVGGTEDALAAFDTQAAIVTGYSHTDTQNNLAIPNSFTADVNSQSVFDAGLTKRTATGGSVQLVHRVEYSRTNATARAVGSDYTAVIRGRVAHPLLRGRGAFINRIPIVLARINEDISVADFEIAIRNLMLDVENTYWDLQCAYRNFETAQIGRDAVQRTWQSAYARRRGEKVGIQPEAQSREQYLFFRAQLEVSLGQLLETEARMRWLLGLAPTDARLIRPVDEPVTADVRYDWNEIRTEALYRSAELRQQKWRIKQRELELANARNLLLPSLNLFLQHEWTGTGDELITADRRGLNFPDEAVGSTAWDNLTEGRFQNSFVGLEFLPPALGARREQVRIRNAELSLRRDEARLEDMELQAVHLLSTSMRNMALNFRQISTHLNRWAAADEEIRAALAAEGAGARVFQGRNAVDVLLDAQRRRALAQSDYYRVVCEFNKAIADLHFRKGSLLEYNGVRLAEGPWPDKAYFDALEKARQRDASHYLRYGWTRPGVISRGPVAQSFSDIPTGQQPQGAEEIQTPQGMPTEADPNSAPMNGAPMNGAPMNNSNPMSDAPMSGSPMELPPGESSTMIQTSSDTSQPHQWGDLGLGDAPVGTGLNGPATSPSPAAPSPAVNPLR